MWVEKNVFYTNVIQRKEAICSLWCAQYLQCRCFFLVRGWFQILFLFVFAAQHRQKVEEFL